VEKEKPMTPDRERIVNNLAVIMRKKLEQKRCIEKGDHWNDLQIRDIWRLFLDEVSELCEALESQDHQKIRHEISDCANYLAMMNDKILYLELTKYIK
jgi:hypothetical protein